eukprot:TRINITY_DN5678_c0_g1_i1.p2 TRINITY_DN5678_c0_g1~~TRINITY_DN5678_c0_g1_i1.p2  ORF type:complete len:270 (+),score=-22.25 TRINITY_DN5678_c0_g1_i1:2421-3230(+)
MLCGAFFVVRYFAFIRIFENFMFFQIVFKLLSQFLQIVFKFLSQFLQQYLLKICSRYTLLYIDGDHLITVSLFYEPMERLLQMIDYFCIALNLNQNSIFYVVVYHFLVQKPYAFRLFFSQNTASLKSLIVTVSQKVEVGMEKIQYIFHLYNIYISTYICMYVCMLIFIYFLNQMKKNWSLLQSNSIVNIRFRFNQIELIPSVKIYLEICNTNRKNAIQITIFFHQIFCKKYQKNLKQTIKKNQKFTPPSIIIPFHKNLLLNNAYIYYIY